MDVRFLVTGVALKLRLPLMLTSHGAADAANTLEAALVERIALASVVVEELPNIIICPVNDRIDHRFPGAIAIAKALVKKGVLIQTPIADGKQVYAAAVLAGDGAKIDKLKEEVRKNGTITKLVEEGTQLASALSLTPSLRLRYAVNTDMARAYSAVEYVFPVPGAP